MPLTILYFILATEFHPIERCKTFYLLSRSISMTMKSRSLDEGSILIVRRRMANSTRLKRPSLSMSSMSKVLDTSKNANAIEL